MMRKLFLFLWIYPLAAFATLTPPQGGAGWKDSVATSASLPPSGNNAGDCRATQDTGIVYCWTGSSWAAPSGAGTVTSVDASVPAGLLTISGNPITGAGTLAFSLASGTANKVFATPNGSSGAGSYRLLVGVDLPLPGSASLGGVFSKSVVSHNFLTGISSADGSVSQAQPAFTDISGSASTAQLPTFLKTNTLGNSLAMVSDSSGNINTATSTTSTEIGYVHGVNSAIQTQINALMPYAGGSFTGPVGYSDGTNAYVITPNIPSGVTCTTSGTVNFNTKASATVPLTLTSSDTCVLTLAGYVTGASYILHILNASGAALTLPAAGSFGGASYAAGAAGTYDNIGIFVVDSGSPYFNYSVIGTGYSH